MDNKLLVTSARNVLGAGLYIFGVSQFMFYGEHLFERMHNQNLMPFAFLLLFSLSAAVVGSLVFGQSVSLFLENKRVESLKSAAYSVIWLFFITLVVILSLIIIK